MENLNEFITAEIKHLVKLHDDGYGYGEPIVGFTTADDPVFENLRRGISPTHFLPEDMLSGAKSIISFFVPVSESTVRSNNISGPSIEYAHVKRMQKDLMESVIDDLKAILAEKGIRCSDNTEGHIPFKLEPPYHPWLQKPIAVACGVGKFGVNRQIITKSGCTGRLGSIVIDAETVPTGKIEEEYCLYFADGSCGECVKHCPVGALKLDDIDRHRCKQQIHKITEDYTGMLKISDNCAQCITDMPCAREVPTQESLALWRRKHRN